MFWDTSENFHPFECDGPGACRHCDRVTTWTGRAHGRATPNSVRDWQVEHDPATCPLCDPAYDGMPNDFRELAAA